jgi:formylglycine-generating enzyme required for sulfatase activity
MRWCVSLSLGLLALGCHDFSVPRGDGSDDPAAREAATRYARSSGSCGGDQVEIPAGSLMIGAPDLSENTLPLTLTEFDTFCIDPTEVTLADYRECFEAGLCVTPDVEHWSGCNWDLAARDEHPVTCVDHARAEDFCAWAGKRLPSEREWEYAARGGAGRLYPWGAESPSANLVNWNDLVGDTTPVGSYPGGATPDTGVLDLAGNVWEWTASEWCDSYAPDALCEAGNYVARGGSFASVTSTFLRSSWRDPVSAGDRRFGFRCAAGAGEKHP